MTQQNLLKMLETTFLLLWCCFPLWWAQDVQTEKALTQQIRFCKKILNLHGLRHLKMYFDT